MSDRLIVFDDRKCIRCHSCEVGCQLENDAPPGIRLRRVKSHVQGRFPEGVERSISTACFHCNDPACVSSCPAGALSRRPDGVVEHRRDRCIGCGYCIQSCPFHVPQVSPAQHTMRKCSFCIQRIDYGKEPACVREMPVGSADLLSPRKGPRSDRRLREGGTSPYGLRVAGKAREYQLPDPVPLNTVTGGQVWKWLGGLVPGAFVLAWIWKMAVNEEEAHE